MYLQLHKECYLHQLGLIELDVVKKLITPRRDTYIPKNTAHCTIWTVCVFKRWVEQCNKFMDVSYPADLLEKSYDIKVICDCLQHFVTEASMDGTKYPPKSLHQFLCGLLRYAKHEQPDAVNFLDRKDQ